MNRIFISLTFFTTQRGVYNFVGPPPTTSNPREPWSMEPQPTEPQSYGASAYLASAYGAPAWRASAYAYAYGVSAYRI